MTIYSVTQGGVVNALDVSQFFNLLTGSMNDQQVTVSNRIRASLTGATSPSGYVGGVAGGPPVSGTFAVGDQAIDTTRGGLWVCTTAGTPGTWSGSVMPISLQTLGSAVSSVTFSSIPQGFNHLQLVMVAQASAAVQFADVSLQFNGDTAANYTSQTWDGISNSSSLSASYTNAQTSMPWVLQVPGTSLNANRVGTGTVLMPRYSSTAFTKGVLSDSFVSDGGATAFSRHRYGLWISTAAITQIVLTCGSGNFVTNSFFGLYGMP